MKKPTDNSIQTVFQDPDFIIVNKPSGLLSVPGLKEPDNLHDRVLAHYPNARVVHRLDMSTSGLVIFALNHASQKQLGQQFEKKQIQKQYIADIFKCPKHDTGEVYSPLICDWERRPIQKIDWVKGKKAHTLYRIIEHNNHSARIALIPITGRTHQLRLHMLQIGHPILGDQLYHIDGSDTLAPRLRLHAQDISFVHPKHGKKMTFHCPVPF